MGQLRWRMGVMMKRLQSIPSRAREAFWKGWSKELHRQAIRRPPPAAGLSIITSDGYNSQVLTETAQAIVLLVLQLPQLEISVMRNVLSHAITNLTIEWVDQEVPEYRALRQVGSRWHVTCCWVGTVWESNLYHILLHFVNMAVRLPCVGTEDKDRFVRHDHDHCELDYWGYELALCSQLRDCTES